MLTVGGRSNKVGVGTSTSMEHMTAGIGARGPPRGLGFSYAISVFIKQVKKP